MANDWFFLSYARLARKDLIQRFYADLNEEIRSKDKTPEDQAGFYDGTGLPVGMRWTSGLTEALASCRVLICMYSFAYFNSDDCGKEWAVFTSRLSKIATKEWPIVPLLLDPPQDFEPVPAVVADIQYVDDKYPKAYRENGLLYLMKRSSRELDYAYQDVLDAVRRRVIYLAKNNPAPKLPPVPDYKAIKPAFPGAAASLASKASNSRAAYGPKYASFIYVSGSRDEVQSCRRNSDNYGEGAEDWKPYLPGFKLERDVAWLTQMVATNEGFRYQRIEVSDSDALIQLLQEEQKNKRLVVLLVDTWSLEIEKYQELMQKYDGAEFWNCAVLVAWNSADQETIDNKPSLQRKVLRIFINKAYRRDPNQFVDDIGTPDQFAWQLSILLQRLKSGIIRVANFSSKRKSGQIKSRKFRGFRLQHFP